MSNFFFILLHVILPVFLQIMVGYVLGKWLKAKSETLVTLQFYILIPAIIFDKMYQFGVDGIAPIMLHSVLLFAGLYLLAWLITKLRRFSDSKATAFINSICYFNSGNFCIPLIQTLYTDSIAMATQIVVMVTQNIITCTVGVFTSASGKWKDCLKEVGRLPMVYMAVLGAAFHLWKVPVYEPLYVTIQGLGNTMVPIALITLGIQLSHTSFRGKQNLDVMLASSIRLILSPVMSFLLGMAIGITGIRLQVLIISAAAPTAVNAVLLAIKYNKEPEFSSKVALLTTVVSAVTVAVVILIATVYI